MYVVNRLIYIYKHTIIVGTSHISYCYVRMLLYQYEAILYIGHVECY